MQDTDSENESYQAEVIHMEDKKSTEKATVVYEKPQVLAQNDAYGSYAAGCPAYKDGNGHWCAECERRN